MPCAAWLTRRLSQRTQFGGAVPCASRGQSQAPRGALENRSQPAGRGGGEVVLQAVQRWKTKSLVSQASLPRTAV